MRWMLVAVLLCDAGSCEPARPPVPPPPAPVAVGTRPQIGRFQIVSHSVAFWNMVLLDTATGDTWLRCREEGREQIVSAWCYMERTTFREPEPHTTAK